MLFIQRFISQHYGVDLSATPEEISAVQGGVGDDGDDCDGGTVRRRSLSLREAIDELTQLRVVRIYSILYALYKAKAKGCVFKKINKNNRI